MPKRSPPCTSAAPSASTRSASSCAAACSSSGSSPRAAWICCPTRTSPRSRACRIACRRCRSRPSSSASPTSSAATSPSASRAFDAEPIAAASLAQVHAAALADGTPVAVKVQVPGIEQIVETDLTALRMLRPGARRSVAVHRPRDGRRRALPRGARRARLSCRSAHAAAFADALRGRRRRGRPARPRGALVAARARARAPRRRAADRLPRRLRGARRRGRARPRPAVRDPHPRLLRPGAPSTGCCTPIPHPGNFLVARARPGRAWRCSTSAACRPTPPSAGTPTRALPGDPRRRHRAHGRAVRRRWAFATRDGDDASLRAFADLLLDAFRADTRPAPRRDRPAAKRWSESCASPATTRSSRCRRTSSCSAACSPRSAAC